MCESAALELGCVVNDIRHVIVCGHSDCKAMNLLYALRDEEFASQVRSLVIIEKFILLIRMRCFLMIRHEFFSYFLMSLLLSLLCA